MESLRHELEASAMERVRLQARVDELLARAADADRLRAELERLKVCILTLALFCPLLNIRLLRNFLLIANEIMNDGY